MNRIPANQLPSAAFYTALVLVAAPVLSIAQDQPEGPPPAEAPRQQQPSAPTPGWHRFSNPPSNDQPGPTMASHLTLKAGTFVTIRTNQFLSSDRNRAGDAFSGTLSQPLVVEGVVVAQRGQTVGGRVVEAQKAGHVKGVSRLALQLTDLTLVDGQQVPIQTQFAGWTGPKSVGRAATAIGGTTALGAVVGAAADWGRGAAIGAGAGAVAATIGVLLTHGRPTEVYPESELTFRLAAPVAISTEHSPQAFRYVETNDYERRSEAQGPPPRGPCGEYDCPPPPPYCYGCWPYPYYYGPSFAFWFGPRFYHHRGFYGRGFRY